MNGIEALIRTLVDGGVDTCFANPGTSEMLFVAAVDKVPEMSCVLCLAEGVVAGAADGYGRMADKPAATLLHLGVGVANAMSGLHGARKAHTPMINLVGQNGSRHLRYESILDADIEGPLAACTDWVRVARHALDLGNDTADAIFEANRAPGRVAALVVQTDAAAGESGGSGALRAPAHPPHPAPATVAQAAELLRTRRSAMIIDGMCLREAGLLAAARLAAQTGVAVFVPGTWARLARGAGLPAFPAFPLPTQLGQQALAGVEALILVGARLPVGSFSYPGVPSSPVADSVQVRTLARPEEDVLQALLDLVEAAGAGAATPIVQAPALPPLPSGATALTSAAVAAAIANLMPAHAILADETSAPELRPLTEGAARHDHLRNTGGAIGAAIPLALGAAVACPDRPVICVQGDGGGMYNLSSIWSLARQRADVTVIIMANRQYRILLNELTRMGVEAPQGGNASALLQIGDPDIDWVALAAGMGVPGARAATSDEFVAALRAALAAPGPHLIEALL